MVAHLAIKHGISPSEVQDRMREYGIKVGDTMLYAAQSMNLFKEARSGGDHKRTDTLSSRGKMQKTRDAASAEAHKILHDFKKRKQRGGDQGRRLGETLYGDEDEDAMPRFPDPQHQSREAKLNTLRYGLRVYNDPKQRSIDPEVAAYAMWRHFNDTKALGPSFKSLERTAQNSRRERRRKLHSASSKQTKAKPRTALDFTDFAPSPSPFKMLTSTIGALQATDGSMLRRLAPAVQAMEAARNRHSSMITGALDRHERRRLEREGRRLSEKPVAPEELYKHLDKHTGNRRHLHMELPGDHALSWVHDVVGGGAGWRDMHHEAKRMARIEDDRRVLREEGKLSHAQIAEMHPTGYDHLDRNAYKPSMLGDFFRRLAARKTTGADPAWVKPRWWSFKARQRRLSEEETTEMPVSVGRRLGQSFFEGIIDAPFAFSDTLLPSGVTVEQSPITLWEGALRYIVYVRALNRIDASANTDRISLCRFREPWGAT